MRRSDSKVDGLGGLALFHACSRRELEGLAEAAELVTRTAGSVLVRQGGAAHEVFVIAAGEVTVSRDGEPITTLSAGDHFGEVGVLASAARDATVTARTDVELYAFEQRRFMAILWQMGSVNRALLGEIASRLHTADLAPRRNDVATR